MTPARPWPALLLLCLAALALPAAAAEPSPRAAPSEPVRILARLPHDPAAFTQGLLLHGGALYESTGLYGQSSLRRVEPLSGRALARRNLPARLFGEGLALCPAAPGQAARLVQLTWREGRVLAADPATLRPLGEFPLRGQGWGLAEHDGELAASDGSDSLRFLSCRSFRETGRTLRVRDGDLPVANLNELEWVNGWLLANVWHEDRVAVIDPRHGRVALWLDLAPLRRELSPGAEAANGVAFDPAGDGGRGTLYLTGKRWETLFVAPLPELLRRGPGSAR